MNKVIFLLLILISISFSKPLIIEACKGFCFTYQFEDVRNWKWMKNEVNETKFMRLTFLNGYLLDLNLNDYDVKVK